MIYKGGLLEIPRWSLPEACVWSRSGLMFLGLWYKAQKWQTGGYEEMPARVVIHFTQLSN
jgi:hypothetical protein